MTRDFRSPALLPADAARYGGPGYWNGAGAFCWTDTGVSRFGGLAKGASGLLCAHAAAQGAGYRVVVRARCRACTLKRASPCHAVPCGLAPPTRARP